MRHLIIIIPSIMLCTFLFTPRCIAQNQTNLPTSMYGIGELSTNDGGRYAGMGQTGVALNRVGFLNTQNPAAITRMDTACFTFDVGATTSYARYHFLSERSTNFTGNPNRFVIGFRTLPRWYTLIGMTPYSSVGYLISTQEVVVGDPDNYLYSYFEGSGGLYKAFLTNAVQLTSRFSIGGSVGIILGKTKQSETQEGATVEHESRERALYVDLGLHYNFGETNGRKWEIGLTFSPSIGIRQDNNLGYSNSSTNETIDEWERSHPQYQPIHIGTGFATQTYRWTFTADYHYIDWSRNVSRDAQYKYENQHKLSIGTLYITQPRKPRSIELMGGASFSNSYISLRGGKMYYAEINAGASFPIHESFLSLGIGWRRQLNSRSNLMQESRLNIHLNLTFGEKIWKSKIK